jgi:hypothetical protein
MFYENRDVQYCFHQDVVTGEDGKRTADTNLENKINWYAAIVANHHK